MTSELEPALGRRWHWRWHSWVCVARDAAAEFRAGNGSIIASGVAFRAVLATFPGVGVLVWLGGILLGRDKVQAALQSFSSSLPDSTRAILTEAMSIRLAHDASSHNAGGLLSSTAPFFGLLLALWSANSGVKALFVALNAIFDRTESRGFVWLAAMTFAFTAAGILLTVAIMALVTALPYLDSLPGVSGTSLTWVSYLRWPFLYALLALALGALYRYAPNGRDERLPFLSVGNLGAAFVLVIGSAGFSWFVNRFASLAVTYGSLSTVVAFMLWLWLSFSVVLGGAEIEAARLREKDARTRSITEADRIDPAQVQRST
jgi:membrane protein